MFKFKLFRKRKPLINPNGRPRAELDLNLILELKKQGKSNREIARQLKVSEGTIRNRIKTLKLVRLI
jgi:DNA invertase Pin-like site-specific DNA recombinase